MQLISLLKSLKKNKKITTKNKKWFDNDLRSSRQNLINFGKVYTKYPKDPYVKNHFYKLYREYNKTRKMKRRIYKSNLLHELETLNEDNPKMYWKMINELQEKQIDSDNNNCISLTRWLKHFQSLNEGKEHFKSRIKDLEDKLKKLEGTNCFNELDFPISLDEIANAISKIKLNKSPGLDNVTNNMIKCSQSTLLKCF